MVGRFLKSFDGTSIYYTIDRKKRGFILFLHGWPHNHTVWDKEARYFRKKGFSTLSMDLRGHGKSGMPDRLSEYRFDRFAKDIDSVVKKEKIGEFVIAGHSFGGMLALFYYSLFPKRVKALVLVDTIYEDPLKHLPFVRHFNLTPLTEHVLKFIIRNEHLKKRHFPYVEFSWFGNHCDFFYWLKGAKETPVKSILCCLEEMLEFNRKSVLKKIRVPTLIIEGEKDKDTPLDAVREMAARIKDCELRIISRASHDTDLKEAVTVEKDMVGFLERVFSGR
jgi:pimeloyl-ACP methyl ester carboxylesterase